MKTEPPTKEKLLSAAKALFWTRGYSNVSVRDITKAAGVDAALVSRYFGGKQGLFEATLEQIGPWDAVFADGDAVLELAVQSFSQPYDPARDQANPFSMLLANVNDPEMGAHVQHLVQEGMAAPLARKLGGTGADTRAAMLLAALFGLALMRKNFQLEVLAQKSPEEIAQMNRHLAKAALVFKG